MIRIRISGELVAQVFRETFTTFLRTKCGKPQAVAEVVCGACSEGGEKKP